MRKNIVFVLVFLLSLSMVSCGVVNSEDNLTSIQACGHYGVLAMSAPDAKHVSVNVIEKDAYGRILFEFSADSAFTEADTFYDFDDIAYVICQKAEKDYTYFYEDICYSYDVDNSAVIEELKIKNDWNEELDVTKMSRRKIKLSFDQWFIEKDDLDYSKIIQSLAQYGIDEKNIDFLVFDDFDGYGKELHVLGLKEIAEQETSNFYLVIVNDSYEVSLLKIDPNDFDSRSIAKFKKANGWKYGF